MKGVLLALTLWCQFFGEEIAKDTYFYDLRMDDWNGKYEPVFEGKTVAQWEEALCGDALPTIGTRSSLPRVRVLGDPQHKVRFEVGRSGQAGN